MKHSILLVRFYACNMTAEERDAFEFWAMQQPLITEFLNLCFLRDSIIWNPNDDMVCVKAIIDDLTIKGNKLELELWPIIDTWVKEHVKPNEYVWDNSPTEVQTNVQINNAISQETIDAFNNIMSANEPTADDDFWQLFHCIKSDIEKQQRKVQ